MCGFTRNNLWLLKWNCNQNGSGATTWNILPGIELCTFDSLLLFHHPLATRREMKNVQVHSYESWWWGRKNVFKPTCSSRTTTKFCSKVQFIFIHARCMLLARNSHHLICTATQYPKLPQNFASNLKRKYVCGNIRSRRARKTSAQLNST